VETLFTTMAEAVTGGIALAFGAAFVWGVLSIVLSPCHLASLPLVVAYVGDGRTDDRRAALLATTLALGILLSIAVVGAITATAGRILGDVGVWGNRVVAAIFLIIGLHLLGVLPLPLPSASARSGGRRGFTGAFLLGLIFGVALGPCTFAFLAPVLGAGFKEATAAPVRGALLLLAFGLGHCGVIAAVGASATRAQHWLDWHERSQGALWMRRVCGGLILIAGFWLL